LSMDYIQKIFKRAKVKNVVDHLLYGYEPDMDIPDYESRMEEAFAQYGETADKYSGNKSSELVDAATALTEVISVVYMEIGFQAELLFMQEVYHNSERGHLLRGTAVRDKKKWYSFPDWTRKNTGL